MADMRVLVADDDLTTCLLLKSMTVSSGVSCDAVHNGYDAVHAVANQDYALAFLALRMPLQKGDEAAVRIQSMKSEKQSPILVGIISYDDAEFRSRCLAAGMSEVIVKPVSRKDVEKILVKYKVERTHKDQTSCSATRPEFTFPNIPSHHSKQNSNRKPAEIKQGQMYHETSAGEIELCWANEILRCYAYLAEKRASKHAAACTRNDTKVGDSGCRGGPIQLSKVASVPASSSASVVADKTLCLAATVTAPSPDRIWLGELMSNPSGRQLQSNMAEGPH